MYLIIIIQKQKLYHSHPHKSAELARCQLLLLFVLGIEYSVIYSVELNDILISSFIEPINGLQSPNQCADPQQYYLQRVKIIDSLFITVTFNLFFCRNRCFLFRATVFIASCFL